MTPRWSLAWGILLVYPHRMRRHVEDDAVVRRWQLEAEHPEVRISQTPHRNWKATIPASWSTTGQEQTLGPCVWLGQLLDQVDAAIGEAERD